MKKFILMITFIIPSIAFAQPVNVNEGNIDVIETQSNPMRPDFGGNLKKRPLKKIKEKNKLIGKNLLESNKLLYKNHPRRNYEERN